MPFPPMDLRDSDDLPEFLLMGSSLFLFLILLDNLELGPAAQTVWCCVTSATRIVLETPFRRVEDIRALACCFRT